MRPNDRLAYPIAAVVCLRAAIPLVASAQPARPTPAAVAPAVLRDVRSRVRPGLGFVPRTRLTFARELEGHVVVVEAIVDDQAARVGCSDLAVSPLLRCSEPETGGAAILVVTDDPARTPFVLALSDEIVIDALVVHPVALDDDPEPEFAVVVGEAVLEEQFDEEGESYGLEPQRVGTRLLIFDLDGSIYLDERLVECGYESDSAYASDCSEFDFTILDEDHDRRPELRVAGAVGSASSSLREDRVGGDSDADDLLLDLEDSVRYFAFVPSARRFVERSVRDR